MSFLMVFCFFYNLFSYSLVVVCDTGVPVSGGFAQFSAINIVLYVAQMPQPVSSMAK